MWLYMKNITFPMILLCLLASPVLAATPSGVDVRDSVRAALAYSPQLQQAQEVRQQAVHDVRRAEAGYYPTIGVWGGGGVMQNDDITTRARGEDKTAVGTGTTGLQFSQPIWQGGGTMAAVRSREATLEARTWEVMDSAATLAFNAIAAHADVLRRRVLLDLAVAHVSAHEKILALLRTRFAQGLSSEGDLEQVKSRLARAEATRIGHRTGLDAALANYVRVTGAAAPGKLLPVAAPTQTFAGVEAVRDASVVRNFRIQTELANIRSVMGEKDFASSRFSPTVSVDGGPAYSDWGYRNTNYQWTWSAMLNMRWELFSGGADEAAFKAAASRVREARKRLHAVMDTLDEEIRVTFVRTRDAQEQALAYGRAKKSGAAARDNFFTQFQAGQKDLLNVLDAESEYYYAAVEENITATDAVLGKYRMLALAGDLLQSMNIDADALKKVPAASRTQDETPWNFLRKTTLDSKEATLDSTLRRPAQ